MIIAFLGRAGSGKSTAAKHLVEKYGATRYSIARGLKEMAKDLYGFTDEQVYGTQEQKETVEPRWGISPRQAMQRLGAAARKHLGEDVWINACVEEIGASDDPRVVIDDVRHLNEVELLRVMLGANVIKLVCPDAPECPNAQHASEAQVDMVEDRYLDEIIESPRTPGSVDLIRKLDECMQGLEIEPVAVATTAVPEVVA